MGIFDKYKKAVIIGMLAFGGSGAASSAADLGDVFKAAASQLPDKLTWKGVTLYGVVDVGYGYTTSGAPVGGAYWGINSLAYATPAGQRPISALPNTQGLSFFGIKFEEEIGGGWKAIGDFKGGFNPLTGQLDDMCAARVANNGKPASQQTVHGQGARCGDLFNGGAWIGLTNQAFGTFSIGKQTSLSGELMYQYDAQNKLPSLSLLLWETPGIPPWDFRWNNSVKWAYQNGPFHAAVMYAQGGQDSGMHGDGYGGTIGANWQSFSIDAVYQKMNSAVSSSVFGVGACGVTGTPSCSTLKVTAANVYDVGLMSRYTYDFGDRAWGGKLSFNAGYQFSSYSTPSNPISVGDTGLGGYTFGSVNNTAYAYGSLNANTFWVGANYQNGPWSFIAAYYLWKPDFYKNSPTSIFCSTSVAPNCAGSMNTASASVIYTADKHLDVYAGYVWSDLHGGLAFGFPTTNVNTFLSGLIFRF
ncbi:MAG TPA: porin [Afipia sp.]